MRAPSLLVVAALFCVAEPPARGQCNGCKPATGTWDWKANGYALDTAEPSARAAAIEHAVAQGCRESAPYLDAMKLKCAPGCNAGAPQRECKPSHEPSCTTGSYERDKGMWTFVCRKAKGKDAGAACTTEAAAQAPFYAMCDVAILASATLACADPACP